MAFFDSVLDAGAILCGFCGTFLSFRIQREANYFRQPAVDFRSGTAKDIPVGLTHFSVSFFLLVLSSIVATLFGFLLPLFALAGADWIKSRPGLVVGGLVAAVVLLVSYYWVELVHYQIFSGRLRHDVEEWGRERLVAILGVVVSAISGAVTYLFLFRN